MSLMVAFLPSDVDAEDLARPGGFTPDDLHTTIRYYGKNPGTGVRDELCGHAARIAADTAPFVASITDRGPLGDDTPVAKVLHLAAPNNEFQSAFDRLPEPGADVHRYPSYRPHLTVGEGIPDEDLDGIDDTVGIRFDRVAVADGDNWEVFPLTGENDRDAVTAGFELFKKKKRTPSPKFTKKQRDDMAESGEAMADGSFPIRNDDKFAADDLARAVQALGRAKDRSATETHIRKRAKALGLTDKLPPWIAKPARTAGYVPGHGYPTDQDLIADMLSGRYEARTAAGRRGRKKQKCYGGSPATCRSVRWIRVYEALRNKGMSKRKAAMISNSMYSHWKSGVPRRRDKRPIVRKAFP